MGNLRGCLAPKLVNKRKATKRLANANNTAATVSSNSSNRWTRIRSSCKEKFFDDALIQEQALAATANIILQQQHNGSLPFNRSASFRYPVAWQQLDRYAFVEVYEVLFFKTVLTPIYDCMFELSFLTTLNI